MKPNNFLETKMRIMFEKGYDFYCELTITFVDYVLFMEMNACQELYYPTIIYISKK